MPQESKKKESYSLDDPREIKRLVAQIRRKLRRGLTVWNELAKLEDVAKQGRLPL